MKGVLPVTTNSYTPRRFSSRGMLTAISNSGAIICCVGMVTGTVMQMRGKPDSVCWEYASGSAGIALAISVVLLAIMFISRR